MPVSLLFVGGEDFFLRVPLLLCLRERGFQVAAAGTGSSAPFRESGIPYFGYSLHRGLNPIADRRSCQQYAEILNDLRPDVVHSFTTKPGLLLPPIARSCSVRAVVRTITGMGYVFSSGSLLARGLRPIYRSMQRRAAQYTDATVFQNSDDMDYFLAKKMTDVSSSYLVPGSGVDTDRVWSMVPQSEGKSAIKATLGLAGKRVVTMIARVIKQKGVREYFEAAASLVVKNPDVVFLLIGPHASEGWQKVPTKEVDAAVRKGHVRYLGTRTDIVDLLSISDVFVLPTYYREGVPRVLLEASACGIPLVATDVPGCRDVVTNGENGLLIKPRDSRALAHAIAELLNDDAARERMGMHARQVVKREFDLQVVADRYATIYRHTVQRSPGRALFTRRP